MHFEFVKPHSLCPSPPHTLGIGYYLHNDYKVKSAWQRYMFMYASTESIQQLEHVHDTDQTSPHIVFVIQEYC